MTESSTKECMKRYLGRFSRTFTLVLIVLVAGCAQPQKTENLLSAAGFSVVPANTPQQLQHLKTLPPYKMLKIQRNGVDRYVYADPAHNLIYVGGLFEYDRYRDMRLAKNLAAEDLQDAKFNAEIASGWDVWGQF
jgi:hypothetical protein